ncbi:hypothetical protein D3C85_1690020 [compost metagenome]
MTLTFSSGTGISKDRNGSFSRFTLFRILAGIGRIRSESGSENIAEWKLVVIRATRRSTLWLANATSIGPLARPRRDTLICG